ncbi:MAG: glycosyltransferase involved in cell wall biosynthesis [Desulforhopalus sp.]|jgi:glycosyltransferase involved in cell wall biosynthesis
MDGCKLSIITVCHNEVLGIRHTAESIINQDYKEFEWIVIDGGSNDGTLEVLYEYKHRTTHLISGQDKGIYDAMNIGASKAKGEYLLFLNGGDSLYKIDTLSACSDYLEKTDVLHGGIQVVSESGQCVQEKQFFDSDITVENMTYRTLPHQGLFMSRILFQMLGGFDLGFAIISDRDLTSRAYVGGASFRSIPFVVSNYVLGGVSNTQKAAVRKESGKFMRKYFFKLWIFDTLRAWFHEIVMATKSTLGLK